MEEIYYFYVQVFKMVQSSCKIDRLVTQIQNT